MTPSVSEGAESSGTPRYCHYPLQEVDTALNLSIKLEITSGEAEDFFG